MRGCITLIFNVIMGDVSSYGAVSHFIKAKFVRDLDLVIELEHYNVTILIFLCSM